jgi:hypothetical protein
MKNLINSMVVFDKDHHTYMLNGKRLSGVTAIVKWLFPDTYKDIPQSVLDKAAEYGTMVHSKCELYDSLGLGDDVAPVQDYIRLKRENGLEALCSEYLVDDGENIASSIDKVFMPDGDTYPLADIKTTSKVHEENVTLQLSIYAYLFELDNPGVKAGRLMCIWLPKPQYGQAAILDLKRIPAEGCQEIVQAFLNNEDPTPHREKWFGGAKDIEQTEEVLPAELKDVEAEVIKIENDMKAMKERQEELRKGLLELMQKHNVKKWQSDRLQLIRKAASTRESVDSTRLKNYYPEIYLKCKKVSNVSESLTIKIL